MGSWVGRLRGQHAHGAELDWVGADGDRVRATLGEGALAWAVEAGEELASEVTERVPAQGEGAHFYALRRATTSTVLRALLLVSDTDTRLDLIGPETLEIARDFARRDVSLDDLQRGIRLGAAKMAAMLLDAAEALAETDQKGELKRISLLLFGQIDSFLVIASHEYLQERSDHTARVSAARIELVQRLVAGADPAATAANQVLDYPTEAPRHLALVAWDADPVAPTHPSLRSTIQQVYRKACADGPTLIVPAGSYAMWAWRALPQGAVVAPPRSLELHEGRCVAVGQAEDGLDGFRASHRQARAVEELMRRRPTPRNGVVAHEDVDLVALLLADAAAARDFVVRHLGPLAHDEPRMRELRRTLLSYLEHQRSTARAAADQHISRNTVTYRVQQALRICGAGSGSSTLRLQAALSVADWLE